MGFCRGLKWTGKEFDDKARSAAYCGVERNILVWCRKCSGCTGVLQLLNRLFRVGVDQTGQFLDSETDLRHAPFIISESGCNTNTEAVSTPREKTTRQTGVRRKAESDCEEK